MEAIQIKQTDKRRDFIMLTVLIVTLFFVGGIALIVWYLKSFYADKIMLNVITGQKRRRNTVVNMAEKAF